MKQSSILLRSYLFAVCLFAATAEFPATVRAVTLPTGFVQETVATGLQQPTAMTFSDGMIFVSEQAGAVRVIDNPTASGAILHTALVIQLNVDSRGERGLLGITFHPEQPANNFMYLYYTVPGTPPHNRISRFTVDTMLFTASPASEQIILELPPLSDAQNHNGGAIHFGIDGKLYVGVGENANGAYAQDNTTLLGKILRLNPDGTIPSDNPFVGQQTARGEIWAPGFRNPFTFAVHPTDGRIFVNDVGESTWEEINQLQKGANYGWPTCEGSCTNAAYTNPIYQYGRSVGQAITGGIFYQGNQLPSEYNNTYFFADYTQTWIKQLIPGVTPQAVDFAAGVSNTIDLDIGPDGLLYGLGILDGTVSRYRRPLPATPTASSAPTSTPGPTVTSTPSPGSSCPLKSAGDANCRDSITLADFDIFRREFNGEVSDTNADFNGNGKVTIADFELWRRGFYFYNGQGTAYLSPTPFPSPHPNCTTFTPNVFDTQQEDCPSGLIRSGKYMCSPNAGTKFINVYRSESCVPLADLRQQITEFCYQGASCIPPPARCTELATHQLSEPCTTNTYHTITYTCTEGFANSIRLADCATAETLQSAARGQCFTYSSCRPTPVCTIGLKSWQPTGGNCAMNSFTASHYVCADGSTGTEQFGACLNLDQMRIRLEVTCAGKSSC